MEATDRPRLMSFRVENIPHGTTAKDLERCFYTEDQPYVQIKSIVPAVNSVDEDEECTATITFQAPSGTIQSPRTLNNEISIDSDFYGFTPLNNPPEIVVAE